MHKRWRAEFLGLPLILAAPARAQDPNTDFTAYRALFSVAALGEVRGPTAVTGYVLHDRGPMPHAAFALAGLPDGRSVWRFVAGQPDAAAARRAAQPLRRWMTGAWRREPLEVPSGGGWRGLGPWP